MTQPGFGPPGPSAALVPVPPGGLAIRAPRRSALAIVTTVGLGLGALVLAVLVLASGGPAAATVTTLLAAVSFPLMILLCFWLDRYEPEPARYRLAALGWGAVGAVIIGGGLTALFTFLTTSSEEVATAVWAPVTEEFGKGLFLLLVLWLRRRHLQGLIDGIIYAVLVGIGFAFTEDILYYLGALAEGGVGGLTVTFFLRGVISPFAHPLFTAATGVGFGIAVTSRSRGVMVAAPLVGYAVAVLLHAIWNGSSVYGGEGAFWLAYIAVMLPLLAALIAVALWARKREGRLLAAALAECAELGWIPAAEVRWVATLPERKTARGYARQVGGKPAAAVLDAYQQALIEMAFLHHRVLTGRAPRDFNDRMGELRRRAASLRPYVLLPPAQLSLASGHPAYPAYGYAAYAPPGYGYAAYGHPPYGHPPYGSPAVPAVIGPPGSTGSPVGSRYAPIPGMAPDGFGPPPPMH